MKHLSVFSMLLLCGVLDAAVARTSRPFGIGKNMASVGSSNDKIVTSTSDAIDAVLIPRGGALDVNAVVKPAIALVGAQGLMGTLSPKTSSDLYGWNSKDSVQNYVMYFMNGALLTSALTMGLQVVYGLSFMEATGYASVGYIVLMLNLLLNKVHETVGAPKEGPCFLLAMHTLVAYAGITGNLPFGDALIKFFGLFSLLNAAIMFVAPKDAMGSWGVKLSSQFQEDTVRGGLASSLLSHGACVCASALYGKDAMKASGWTFLAWIPFLVKEFIQPNTIDKRPSSLLWIVVDSLVAYATLLE